MTNGFAWPLKKSPTESGRRRIQASARAKSRVRSAVRS